MTSTQTDVQMLRQAIPQLTRREREELAEWILNSPDIGSWVAEAALPYGDRRFFTVEEYLSFDEESPRRYEYVAGRIFAMSPTLVQHEVITTNLIYQFQSQLRGTP